MQLQFRLGVSLKERKSLVIFDEVQKCPKARQAIKHLVADGRYDYIETGSLISIKKNVKDILIPSEEEKLFLYPMDYEEFKWALGDNTAIPQLRMLFDKKTINRRCRHPKANERLQNIHGCRRNATSCRHIYRYKQSNGSR